MKKRFKKEYLCEMWMSEQINQLQWLNTKYRTLLDEIKETESGETTNKIIELLELSQQINAQIILRYLAEQQQLRSNIDSQLLEISHYLQKIVTSHIREAENLEKTR